MASFLSIKTILNSGKKEPVLEEARAVGQLNSFWIKKAVFLFPKNIRKDVIEDSYIDSFKKNTVKIVAKNTPLRTLFLTRKKEILEILQNKSEFDIREVTISQC